jgi:preprotein translocase subunit SecE
MADELTINKNPWQRFREYVADVRTEMKHVTWPSKQEIYGTTVMVILTTFLFGAYFALCDKVFGAVVVRVLKYFTHRA